MDKFTDHVPPDLLESNLDMQHLLEVIDGMQKIKRDEIDKYSRSLMYPLVSDIATMKRYVDSWGAEYTDNSSRLCIDCLYRNYIDIYTKKGTYPGLRTLLTCLLTGDSYPVIIITGYRMGKPLILFDDDRPYDWLPEGADIAAEIEAATGEEIWVPTLLDDTWEHQRTLLQITVTGMSFVPTPEFIEFVKSVIVLYLPMVKRDFVNIELNII